MEYQILESKLNNHTIEELELMSFDYEKPILNKVADILYGANISHISALNEFVNKVCLIDQNKPANGVKRVVKPYYDKYKKRWTARLRLNRRDVYIKVSVDKNVVDDAVKEFCEKHDIDYEL